MRTALTVLLLILGAGWSWREWRRDPPRDFIISWEDKGEGSFESWRGDRERREWLTEEIRALMPKAELQLLSGSALKVRIRRSQKQILEALAQAWEARALRAVAAEEWKQTQKARERQRLAQEILNLKSLRTAFEDMRKATWPDIKTNSTAATALSAEMPVNPESGLSPSSAAGAWLELAESRFASKIGEFAGDLGRNQTALQRRFDAAALALEGYTEDRRLALEKQAHDLERTTEIQVGWPRITLETLEPVGLWRGSDWRPLLATAAAGFMLNLLWDYLKRPASAAT